MTPTTKQLLLLKLIHEERRGEERDVVVASE
jgi:hypothetical protein